MAKWITKKYPNLRSWELAEMGPYEAHVSDKNSGPGFQWWVWFNESDGERTLITHGEAYCPQEYATPGMARRFADICLLVISDHQQVQLIKKTAATLAELSAELDADAEAKK
jgi:hypothetical protein